MKKVLCVFMLLFVVTGVWAQTFIGFEGELEAGLADGLFGDWAKDEDGSFLDYSFNEFRTTYLKVGGFVWLFEHVYVGGDATVQMMLSSRAFETGMDSIHDIIPNYNPTFINYNFEVGVSLFDVLTVFVSHDCVHPQTTYPYSYKVTSLWGEGAITRVGLRFRSETAGVGTR